jgi:membrane protein DedA with SNARE-associated domain
MFDFITSWMEAGGLWAVGALMVLENVFPPIPSELIVPLAGFQAAQGSFGLLPLVLVATLGSVAGSTLWYALARAWGRERFLRFVDRYGVWLTLTRGEAEGAAAWFERHGRAAVLLGRMVPTIRTLISVPAGLSGMPWGTFLVFTAIGSAGWTAALALAGYLLQSQYERVEVWLNPVTTIVVLLIVGLYLYRVIRALRRR